jgi:hypothetical protein
MVVFHLDQEPPAARGLLHFIASVSLTGSPLVKLQSIFGKLPSS